MLFIVVFPQAVWCVVIWEHTIKGYFYLSLQPKWLLRTLSLVRKNVEDALLSPSRDKLYLLHHLVNDLGIDLVE